jgi:hypothetical protein
MCTAGQRIFIVETHTKEKRTYVKCGERKIYLEIPRFTHAYKILRVQSYKNVVDHRTSA